MGRKSSVKTLPQEIQESIHRLLDGGQTLDAILEHLDGLGAKVSRSALGRYAQGYEEVAQKLRETRDIATYLGSRLEGQPNDVGRITTELLHKILFKMTLKQLDSDDPDISARDLMSLGRALKDMTSATKTSADMELKIREASRAEALRDAAKAVDTTGQEKGLTAETVKAIKAKILGIR